MAQEAKHQGPLGTETIREKLRRSMLASSARTRTQISAEDLLRPATTDVRTRSDAERAIDDLRLFMIALDKRQMAVEDKQRQEEALKTALQQPFVKWVVRGVGFALVAVASWFLASYPVTNHSRLRNVELKAKQERAEVLVLKNRVKDLGETVRRLSRQPRKGAGE